MTPHRSFASPAGWSSPSKRSFLSPYYLALFFGSLTCLCAQSLSPVNVNWPQSLPASQPFVTVQDNYFGVSYELSSFNTLWGQTTSTIPNAMKNYMANLRARIHSPLRIRIGGNGMDSSTFVLNQTQMIILTDPNADYNDVPVDFGPTFFDVLNAMADAVGEMMFTIGLSMQVPSHDMDEIELAWTARRMLGDRLDSMLLGNEPDLYAGHGTRANYTIQDYIPEIGKVLDDLRNSPYGDLIPSPIIGGPTICCSWNLSDVLSAGLTQYPYKYYTLQHYPRTICGGLNAKNTNISYFTSHTNVPVFTGWQSEGIQMAYSANVPILMSEYNSVSCGGSNVSNTFAAALWAVDVALGLANTTISAAYIHTREYGVLYNLFDPPSQTDSTGSGWRTGSPYYAALFLSETFMENGAIVLDLNLDNSNHDPTATVAGYALYSPDKSSVERLVLINYGNSGGTPLNFTLAQGVTSSIGMRILSAPSITETTEISWAGQRVGSNGELQGTQSTQWFGCEDGCSIGVPGPGAALVLLGDTMDDTGFYVGNSTIAGLGYPLDSPGSSSSSSSSLSTRIHGFGMTWTWTAVVGVSLLMY